MPPSSFHEFKRRMRSTISASATLPASGFIAGVFARTDSQRGVWKAPAGIDAVLRGAQGLSYLLTDPENGTLNPLGVNCIRNFPVYGNCLGRADVKGRRSLGFGMEIYPGPALALFIEESLFRGTKWVVFEPNDDPLWAQIASISARSCTIFFGKARFRGPPRATPIS